MNQENISNQLWVVVTLENKLFAIPVDNVQTMVTLPEVSSVPNVPEHVRGVINLRGTVMPVIDLRTRLGLHRLRHEINDLIEMLKQKEKDHIHWVEELEKAVTLKREFKLTTDPHKCAFGVWYDSFKTNNLLLQSHLKKFKEPHKRIHAVAEKVLSLEVSGHCDEAQKIIQNTREGDLAEMVSLFASLQTLLIDSIREIAIVITTEKQTFAVIVDSVETVTHLSIEESNRISNLGLDHCDSRLFDTVGKMGKSENLVLTLNPQYIYDYELAIA